jgi:hypothetical protein
MGGYPLGYPDIHQDFRGKGASADKYSVFFQMTDPTKNIFGRVEEKKTKTFLFFFHL